MKEIIVSDKDAGQTIYKYVRKYLSSAPLSFIEKLFRIKDVKVNTKRVNKTYVLKKDDVVLIYVNEDKLKDFEKSKPIIPCASSLDIIYEDENILIINKPRGILIHGDENEKRLTLSNQVLNYLASKNEYDAKDVFVPSPAHRLDRNTSGLVVFGKNIESLQELFLLFKEKDVIEKHYLALVEGLVKKDGEIKLSLLKDETKGIVKVSRDSLAKSAHTKYYVRKKFEDKTLLDALLITGRTHQLRVHFAAIKHPICGDQKYGDFELNKMFEKKFGFHDQFLHAYKIIFKSLRGKLGYLSNKTFEAPLPKKEENILKKLEEEL